MAQGREPSPSPESRGEGTDGRWTVQKLMEIVLLSDGCRCKVVHGCIELSQKTAEKHCRCSPVDPKETSLPAGISLAGRDYEVNYERGG